MSAALWLIGLPLVGTPLIYLWGRAGRRLVGASSGARAMSVGVLGLLWLIFFLTTQETASASTSGALAPLVDSVSVLMSMVVLLVGTAALLCSLWFMRDEPGEEYFFACLMSMMGAMIGLSMASDLFVLWIWFELLGISSYFLVAFYRGNALAAGMRYLVQSAVGSLLILLGIALIFAQTGTLAFDLLSSGITDVPMVLSAGVLLLVGFGVKVAIVPLHTWLADAHSQAPAGVSAVLSGVVLAAALAALLRALAPLLSSSDTWPVVLMTLGVVNMVVGNLLALRQVEIKRMLAYSSISHMGYMLLGFGISFSAGTADGAQGAFFHLLNHGLMKALAFLAVGAMAYAIGAHSLRIDEMSGAIRRFPLVSLSLIVALLGLGGVPLLAGFMSKWQIFVAGFVSQNTWIALLVLFAAVNSVFSLAYYAPVINVLVRQQMSPALAQTHSLPLPLVLILLLLAVGIVLLGIAPDLVGELTQSAAGALMRMLGI